MSNILQQAGTRGTANEIPLDILLVLYHLVMDDWNPETYRKHPLIVFSTVCQNWRRVFTEMLPELWTHVQLTQFDQFNPESYLQKSNPSYYSLSMNLRAQSRHHQGHLERTNRQLDLQMRAVAHHLDRLQNLNLRLNSRFELESLLCPLKSLTAKNLRSIYVSLAVKLELHSTLPHFQSAFPEAPNLKHITSPGRCSYHFPANLTSLTFLELSECRLSLADYRKLFSSVQNLQTLCIQFCIPFELRDPSYMRDIHSSQTWNLIEVPSLQYLSVHIPSIGGDNLGRCPCFLPVFHFPNLKSFAINLANGFDHLHPSTIQAWNDPSSSLERIRVKEPGLGWSAHPITKPVHLEWACGPQEVHELHNERPPFTETKSTTLYFLNDGLVERDKSDTNIASAWLAECLSRLNGPVTVQFPTVFTASDGFTESLIRCWGDRLAVVYSDQRRNIWNDVKDGGGDAPKITTRGRDPPVSAWA